ncbi:hypothetical protein [Flavobacterium cerinum]|uniref:DUF4468 domain-containing protein n=1 Tax=Flavobacterium cerinum TaxID=2502784 RepID=A0A444HC51_9FLAO|nr:hypothetical protein [Flavobacterium cerinum]RWX01039.1 hypothetical protein EPI11_08435 [Flavobacterium cerinum]
MQKLLPILCLFIAGIAIAQPQMVLMPYGFDPVEVQIPSISQEKFIELSKSWAAEFNRGQKGYDVSDVTSNSLTITAYKRNAFFYRNLGETFQYTIRYSMKLNSYGTYYKLVFTITDIYANDDVLINYKIPDYFSSSGQLKDGYSDIKPSLEKTVNYIAASHYSAIASYK